MANHGDARGYTLTPDQWAAIPDDGRGVVLRAREDIDDPWPRGTLYTSTVYVPGSGHIPGRPAIAPVHLDTPETTRAARIALLERELTDAERHAARHPEDAAAGPFVGALRAWLSRERVGDGQSGEDDLPGVDASPPHSPTWRRVIGSIWAGRWPRGHGWTRRTTRARRCAAARLAR